MQDKNKMKECQEDMEEAKEAKKKLREQFGFDFTEEEFAYLQDESRAVTKEDIRKAGESILYDEKDRLTYVLYSALSSIIDRDFSKLPYPEGKTMYILAERALEAFVKIKREKQEIHKP